MTGRSQDPRVNDVREPLGVVGREPRSTGPHGALLRKRDPQARAANLHVDTVELREPEIEAPGRAAYPVVDPAVAIQLWKDKAVFADECTAKLKGREMPLDSAAAAGLALRELAPRIRVPETRSASLTRRFTLPKPACGSVSSWLKCSRRHRARGDERVHAELVVFARNVVEAESIASARS